MTLVDARLRFLRKRATHFAERVIRENDGGVQATDWTHKTLDPSYYRKLESEIIKALSERGYTVHSIDLFSSVD